MLRLSAGRMSKAARGALPSGSAWRTMSGDAGKTGAEDRPAVKSRATYWQSKASGTSTGLCSAAAPVRGGGERPRAGGSARRHGARLMPLRWMRQSRRVGWVRPRPGQATGGQLVGALARRRGLGWLRLRARRWLARFGKRAGSPRGLRRACARVMAACDPAPAPAPSAARAGGPRAVALRLQRPTCARALPRRCELRRVYLYVSGCRGSVLQSRLGRRWELPCEAAGLLPASVWPVWAMLLQMRVRAGAHRGRSTDDKGLLAALAALRPCQWRCQLFSGRCSLRGRQQTVYSGLLRPLHRFLRSIYSTQITVVSAQDELHVTNSRFFPSTKGILVVKSVRAFETSPLLSDIHLRLGSICPPVYTTADVLVSVEFLTFRLQYHIVFFT